MVIIFWLGLFFVFYAYLGYGALLFLMVGRQQGTYTRKLEAKDETAAKFKVTYIVCAYNESDWISQKVQNSLSLIFPSESIRFVFVTDGSDDDTPQKARTSFESSANKHWHVIHSPERRGKIAAFHRAIQIFGVWDDCPPEKHIIISTDANTLINPEAVLFITRHFNDPQTGAVAGEKRIQMGEKDAANAAGEGIYWKYESLLKKWDSRLWSVVGAAGELFAIRSDLYEAVPADTIVEDFYLTMRIAQKGYRVAYEPNAYAVESSSASIPEELKRKVRIAAGGLQAAVRLAPILNIFRYGTLSFQYISHRLLRWTLAPLSLPLILLSNIFLALEGYRFYQIILGFQLLFYALATLGWLLERRQIKIKVLFIPYYFCLMNYAMYAGFFRLLKGKQSVIWEKSERAR